MHIQRPITGRLNHAALRTLYDLLVDQTGSLGARIGRAVVIAEAGAAQPALEALDTMPMDRVVAHQPWWVARARVAALARNMALQKECLGRAIDLTEDAAVRTFLIDQQLGLGSE